MVRDKEKASVRRKFLTMKENKTEKLVFYIQKWHDRVLSLKSH